MEESVPPRGTWDQEPFPPSSLDVSDHPHLNRRVLVLVYVLLRPLRRSNPPSVLSRRTGQKDRQTGVRCPEGKVSLGVTCPLRKAGRVSSINKINIVLAGVPPTKFTRTVIILKLRVKSIDLLINFPYRVEFNTTTSLITLQNKLRTYTQLRFSPSPYPSPFPPSRTRLLLSPVGGRVGDGVHPRLCRGLDPVRVSEGFSPRADLHLCVRCSQTLQGPPDWGPRRSLRRPSTRTGSLPSGPSGLGEVRGPPSVVDFRCPGGTPVTPVETFS